jgi:hypothetical protein
MSEFTNLAFDLFVNDAHLSINKKAIKILGLLPAILLSDLLSKAKYFTEKGTLDNDGFFFSEQSYIKEDLDLSEYHQKNAGSKLVDLDIVETKRVGIPPRIWYKIDYALVITNILNISDIKTKNLIYNNKNKYNKLTKVSKRVSPSVNKDDLFLLEEWRLKKQIPTKQHHLREGTKLHSKIANLTKWLLNGTFIHHCDLSQEFLNSINLTKAKLTRKYSKDELLAGLDEMADMFKENNLPEDKTKISNMDFASLIYHPMARMSYLIKYMYRDCKTLEYKTVQVFEHWLDRVYIDSLFNKDIENDNHQFGVLKAGLASIEEYHEWMIENMGDIPERIKTEDRFFNAYIDWINEHVCNNLTPYDIGVKSKNWSRFLKWLKEALYGDHAHQYSSLDKKDYK